MADGSWKQAQHIRPGGKVQIMADVPALNHAETYAQIEVEISEAKIVELKRPRRTYNFAVEEDESYIAKGFVVSNCRCVSIPILEKN
jgi:hypothetical protein